MKIKDYSIIETEWIDTRIDELTELRNFHSEQGHSFEMVDCINELRAFQQIKSKIKPLIPIVENAYDAGMLDKELSLSFDNPKGRYLSSIKLDI
jgi:hypothetical protein